jgi:ABC-type branched-subunit amino acid transport system ATPase component
VIANVSLDVALGEMMCVIGPNGAGKSTLLKAIAGELAITDGAVALAGERITGLRGDRLAHRGVGYVPQVNDVFETLTVRENLEMGGYLLPAPKVSSRLDEVVSIFPRLGLLLRRQASKLSGGERKMLAVARALMNRPTVLLLDEPTANLSPELSRSLLGEHVVRLVETGVAVLLVEQKASAALEVSDRACLMTSGELRLSAPAAELRAREDIGELFLGGVGR